MRNRELDNARELSYLLFSACRAAAVCENHLCTVVANVSLARDGLQGKNLKNANMTIFLAKRSFHTCGTVICGVKRIRASYERAKVHLEHPNTSNWIWKRG
jgi:hypothetical protein